MEKRRKHHENYILMFNQKSMKNQWNIQKYGKIHKKNIDFQLNINGKLIQNVVPSPGQPNPLCIQTRFRHSILNARGENI